MECWIVSEAGLCEVEHDEDTDRNKEILSDFKKSWFAGVLCSEWRSKCLRQCVGGLVGFNIAFWNFWLRGPIGDGMGAVLTWLQTRFKCLGLSQTWRRCWRYWRWAGRKTENGIKVIWGELRWDFLWTRLFQRVSEVEGIFGRGGDQVAMDGFDLFGGMREDSIALFKQLKDLEM